MGLAACVPKRVSVYLYVHACLSVCICPIEVPLEYQRIKISIQDRKYLTGMSLFVFTTEQTHTRTRTWLPPQTHTFRYSCVMGTGSASVLLFTSFHGSHPILRHTHMCTRTHETFSFCLGWQWPRRSYQHAGYQWKPSCSDPAWCCLLLCGLMLCSLLWCGFMFSSFLHVDDCQERAEDREELKSPPWPPVWRVVFKRR